MRNRYDEVTVSAAPHVRLGIAAAGHAASFLTHPSPTQTPDSPIRLVWPAFSTVPLHYLHINRFWKQPVLAIFTRSLFIDLRNAH